MQKGSIIQYRHKDGSGDVSFQVQYRDASGKQVRETIGRKSEGWTKTGSGPKKRMSVQAELAERISRVATKGYRKPEPVTFETYSLRWLEEGQKIEGWKRTTIITYRCAVKRLNERFGRKRLEDIERQDINTFAADLLGGDKPLAERTVNLTLTVAHSIFDRAVDEELIQSNPASRARRPKNPRYKPRPLTVAEARAVEARIKDPSVKLAFVTAEILGLRWSEIRGLRWKDIDLLTARLRVEDSKTPDGERSVSLPAPMVSRFERRYQETHYKHDSDFVFCHREKGSQANPEHYRSTVKEAARAVGILERFRPFHDMRVTSATSGVLADEHTSKLMTRHGWTRYETADRYIKLAGQVFPDEGERLAALRLSDES
jgi:integrase